VVLLTERFEGLTRWQRLAAIGLAEAATNSKGDSIPLDTLA
jgi:hypothetical protein